MLVINIHVKRTVSQIYVLGITFHCMPRKKLITNFYKLHTFRKASYSVFNTLKYIYVS